MQPFRTILFAADFSENSKEAFAQACSLAVEDKTKLFVLRRARCPVMALRSTVPAHAAARHSPPHRLLASLKTARKQAELARARGGPPLRCRRAVLNCSSGTSPPVKSATSNMCFPRFRSLRPESEEACA